MGWVKGKGHKVQNREEDCHRVLFLWPSDFFSYLPHKSTFKTQVTY